MRAHDFAGADLLIDLDALAANYRGLRASVAPAEVAGVVKANGYGLGADRVAATLAACGCLTFFVAQLCEAEALRPMLEPDASLFVLNGLLPGAERLCHEIGAIPVLNSLDQVDRWADLSRGLGIRLPAALQFDTGMSRLGLARDEVTTLIEDRGRLDGIDLRLLMSHLACGDDPEAEANVAQQALFASFVGHFPGIPRSLDNSGGSFLPRDHLDIVRAGIALYGGAPQQAPSPMEPVVFLRARIAQLRSVPAGSGVGYGLTHKVSRPSRIATIPLGYADGWPRDLSNRGSAFIGGMRVPIVGRVSMDSITLDVTDMPEVLVHPGALVELIGPNQTIDDVAADAGTIPYEILTQLGHRYRREYRPMRNAEPKRSMCI